MNPIIHNFRYRPEIDGLRAIAVLAVVLFHAGLGFPGGYVGVDVFFVISGFLITSIIIKDLQTGTFSFAHFWERRARRILPASTVMVLTTLAAGWFLLLPSDYAKLAASAVWQSVFSGNFYFWRSTDYFAGPAEEVPLLHTWSLAVEEQYYFLFPFILFALFRFPALRKRSALIAIFSVGAISSLALSVYAVPRMPVAAFYLLPTRAWELLCGSLIAVLPAPPPDRNQKLVSLASYTALAAILTPCFVYTADTPFPGLAALPPCLGAALFIWATQSSPATLPLPAKVLATRPFVFVGLISYSLYLWHWPLFAFVNYWSIDGLSLTLRVTLITAGFALAILSWHYVETPFRVRRLGYSRSALFTYTSLGSGAVAIAGLLISINAGVPSRIPPAALAYAATAEEPRNPEASLQDVVNGRFIRLGSSDPSARTHVFLWGDSHARALIPAIERLCEEHGVTAEVATYSSTAPILDFPQVSNYGLKGDELTRWTNAIFQHIRQKKIPHVVLAGRWSVRLGTASRDERGRSMSDALLETIEQLRGLGTDVWIADEVPNHPIAVPKALAFNEYWPSAFPLRAATTEMHRDRSRAFSSLIPLMKVQGANVISLSQCFRDSGSNCYKMVNDLQCLYYDDHHLSRAGSLFAKSAFEPIFQFETVAGEQLAGSKHP